MAVALRNTASANNAGGSSIACNIPTGTVAGDLLLANIIPNAGTTLTVTMTGWTAIVPPQTNNNTVAQYLYYRIATGTEGASVSVGFNTSPIASMNIGAYSGVDSNNPFAGIAQSTSTTSTTVTFPAATPKAETVYAVTLAGTRNVTSTNTVSVASSGYNVSADTCGSAASFVQAFIEDTHTTYGLPIANVTPGTATITPNTANQCRTTVLLRADMSATTTPVVETLGNTSIVGATTATVTSTTGYATAYVVQVNVGGGGSAPTGVANTSGLSWTKAIASNVSNPTEIWVAYSSTALTNDVVTVTWAASTTARVLVSAVKNTATSPIGATASGNALSQNLTTTAANSLPFWTITYLTYASGTAATSNTIVEQAVIVTTTGEARGHYTAVVAVAGTVTTGLSAPTGKTYDTVAVEILAAPGTSLPMPKIIMQSINRAGTF